VINTFFRYDFKGESHAATGDLSVSLSINNLLDKDPPENHDNGVFSSGFANGLTVGRMVQFGVSKKF
jgi:iron complex outermembrane receptor protein